MEIVKFNFLKKSSMDEKYGKLKSMLVKKGYKHLSTTISYSLSCKESKKSNYPSKRNKDRVYPYTITITSTKAA